MDRLRCGHWVAASGCSGFGPEASAATVEKIHLEDVYTGRARRNNRTVSRVRDPYEVIVELVTAVALAPPRLEDHVEAIIDILLPEVGATLGLLARVDSTDLEVQVIGHRVDARGSHRLRQRCRPDLDHPLLEPVLRGDLTPTTTARVLTPAAWAGSPLQATCILALRVNQVASLPVIGGRDAVVLMVGRVGEDFSDGDLALLRAAQPVVTGLGMLLSFPWRGHEPESSGASGGARLTVREVEVLELLSQGFKAAVIARKAGCSPRTVHRHLGHIYDKLGVSDRLSAVTRAQALGVLAHDRLDVH